MYPPAGKISITRYAREHEGTEKGRANGFMETRCAPYACQVKGITTLALQNREALERNICELFFPQGLGNYFDLVKQSVALWPPKPRELLRAASMFISRASLGT